MENFLRKYNNTVSFEEEKSQIKRFPHYTVLDEEANLVYVKIKVPSEITFVTTGETTIYEILEDGRLKEISLENGTNVVKGLPYGFQIREVDETTDENLEEYIISIDASKYDISNISNTKNMFYKAKSLKSIDFSNWDFTCISDMSGMFDYCEPTELFFKNAIITNQIINAIHGNLTNINLEYVNTSNVTDMNQMFSFCSGLTSLDLSSFDTSNVSNMGEMFNWCSGLTSLDLSSFDTSKVTNMGSMFNWCNSLTSLDVSNFDTSKVTNMWGMFYNCESLVHIKCKQAFKDWCWTNQDDIDLPSAMQDGGSGTWEIVA